jgi:hypothetical protein
VLIWINNEIYHDDDYKLRIRKRIKTNEKQNLRANSLLGSHKYICTFAGKWII